MKPRIAVLDYGMGNLRSVAKAIQRVDGTPLVTSNPADVEQAAALVVPGVGAFGACMGNLEAAGLGDAIRTFGGSGRPVLGVCLGMQVLFDWSEEGAVDGLGLLEGKVQRLPNGEKIPHMGWNSVTWTRDHPLLTGIPNETLFYFVHSYVASPSADVVVGETDYGVPFASIVAQGNIVGMQFHPEKSGSAGLEIYRNLVREAA
ncbi:MAG: imidazole glycerol phosphate synthase subunit HisH [Actinomycetota bacterium]